MEIDHSSQFFLRFSKDKEHQPLGNCITDLLQYRWRFSWKPLRRAGPFLLLFDSSCLFVLDNTINKKMKDLFSTFSVHKYVEKVVITLFNFLNRLILWEIAYILVTLDF